MKWIVFAMLASLSVSAFAAPKVLTGAAAQRFDKILANIGAAKITVEDMNGRFASNITCVGVSLDDRSQFACDATVTNTQRREVDKKVRGSNAGQLTGNLINEGFGELGEHHSEASAASINCYRKVGGRQGLKCYIHGDR